MTARFPQSTSSLAYQIKPEYASKILVMYFAASADSIHRLRSNDTATTLITRAASGCAFNAVNGTITGTPTGLFTDSIAGGYGGLIESSNYAFGTSVFGDTYNGVSQTLFIGSAPPPDSAAGGFKFQAVSYGISGSFCNNSFTLSGYSDNVDKWIILAARTLQSDGTAKQRFWEAGTEIVGKRTNQTIPGTGLLGDTARPLYIGGSRAGTGNTRLEFEFAFLGTSALTDADMAAISADPSILIQAVAGAVISASASATPSSSASLTTYTPAITIPAVKNLTTGTLRTGETGITVIVNDLTTGALVVKKTAQTTDASGNCAVTDAALVAATTYRVTTILADGSEGTWKYTAA